MSGRITYALTITLNGRVFNRVVIDQHYKNKHADTINDLLILKLVKSIDGELIEPDKQNESYQYITVEPLFLSNKPYRLVITICIFDDFLGVVNAYRINRRDYD
jgi:hypothetical protein